MGCCKKLFKKREDATGAVVCLRWVLPLRIIVLAGLLASGLYAVTHADRLSMRTILLLVIQLILSARILSECRRSVLYHQAMERMTGPQ